MPFIEIVLYILGTLITLLLVVMLLACIVAYVAALVLGVRVIWEIMHVPKGKYEVD